MQEGVRVDVAGARASVTWQRGPLNVFDAKTLEALAAALASQEVLGASVVVLEGRGRGWSAGLAVEEHLRPGLRGMLAAFDAALHALWDVPGPVLAKVRGPCLGGGLELLALCDLAVATEDATFGQPEIKLGVFPPLGAALYPRLFGSRTAAELLFLGDALRAAQAREAGLVNRVVPEGALDAEAEGLVTRLLATRREALFSLKKALRSAQPKPWPALAAAERVYVDELMRGDDAEEGLRAFLEKRPPAWSRRGALARHGQEG